MKISIIIPVYNSKKYLNKCLDSIKNQTYKNLEVILVDDGSTDNSLEICKNYEKKDKRFKVFHKKNGGTSSARNYGLKQATGDYITFMDNDDYVNNKDAFNNIYNQLKKTNPDILFHNCIYYWEDKNSFTKPNTNFDRNKIIDQEKYESLKYLIKEGIFTYTVWDKVIKADLVKDNNLKFTEGMRNEDTEFSLKLFELSKKYDYLNKPFYVYRKNHSYAQTSKLKYQDTLDLKNILNTYINKYANDDTEMKFYIHNYISYLFAVYIAQTNLLFKHTKNKKVLKDLKDMEKYKFLLHSNLNPCMKKVSLVYKVCGFDITKLLLTVYIKYIYKLKIIDTN